MFSIIIPTYNRAHFITHAINSVLKQTYTNFELIVIDDGSTDNTEEIVENFKNEKIIYHKIENSERSFARNYGASVSKGDYINFLDSDDTLYPNHLSEAIQFIKKNNGPEIFHLNYDIKNSVGNVVQERMINTGDLNLNLVKRGNKLSCNGVFLRKDICIKHPFNIELSQSEDYELWLRLAAEYSIQYSNTVTSSVVNHQNRSIFYIEQNYLIDQFQIQIDALNQNKKFIEKYGNYLNHINANNYSYISLHSALGKENRFFSIKYLFKSLKLKPQIVFSKRFLAIVKHLII